MILNSVDHFYTLLFILLPNIAHHKPIFQTLDKLVVPHLVKKSPEFYVTPMLIPTSTRYHRLSLSGTRLIESTPPHPRPIYLRPLERLCFQIHLVPPSDVFLSYFRTKILLPHACHMSRPYRAI